MLCTKQKVLRCFWYATLPICKLKDGPKPFTLMGENLVLFLDRDGAPAALRDRCCHRTARLSKGWCRDGHIICGYHGWEYERSGRLVRIPQFPSDQPLPNARVPAFRCAERYGYAWVALDEPLLPIPELPQDRYRNYRRIHQFDDRWNCGALRMMENSFDNAHFSFVHRATFGQEDRPRPEKYELVETNYGFRAESVVPINNPPEAYRVTGTTIRSPHGTCAMPGSCRSAARWTSNIRRGCAISFSTPQPRSTTAASSSCRYCSAMIAKKIARPRN